MSQTTIIVATPFAEDLHRCQQIIDGIEDWQIVAHAPGLMEVFSKVESEPPRLVLLSADLCQKPEFELLVTLFNALDVRWSMFENGARHAAARHSAASNRSGGIFPLKLDGDNRMLNIQLRSVMNAQQSAQKRPFPEKEAPVRRYKRMVLLGASTGGVDALKMVLSDFDAHCPPTIVVQHTGIGFGTGLSTVLSRSSGAKIKMFESNVKIESGTVYIVAGLSHHVVLSGRGQPRLVASTDPPESGHCPSVDKMFQSGVPYAPRIVAAILTGMGRDGAEGLLALRNAGARTLSQDEDTSVVYGMPAHAWSLGGAMRQVALDKIGACLLAEAAR